MTNLWRRIHKYPAMLNISYLILSIIVCIFFFSPAFAFVTETTEPASKDKSYSTDTSKQINTSSKATKEGNEPETSSEEDQYLQKLTDIATTTSDEDEEEITYDVPVVINDKVEVYIKYFQTRGRKYFEKWLARSEQYLPMVKEILRQHDLPEDLAYLALIESGFNPYAKSRAKAVGMWQFMKWTGKKYGLKVDMWVDERRDPEKATWAAARYLKGLYDIFNSWHLAAASYNAGEGRILRAVKKHNTDDFWIIAKHKRTLKRETRDYIPKYIAALLIAKEPEKYGFADIKYLPHVAYAKAPIPGATDIKIIVEACECSAEEIKELNPELLRWFTPPNVDQYEIKIPAEKIGNFHANFATIPPQERLNFLVHKIRKGETLSLIAKRYNTSTESILYLNKLRSARYIKAGAEIIVPVRGKRVATPETTAHRQKS